MISLILLYIHTHKINIQVVSFFRVTLGCIECDCIFFWGKINALEKKKNGDIFVTQHWKKYIACKNLCFLLNLLFLCNFACPNSSIKVGKK